MAELNQQALEEYNPFQGPIPGQSLTNSEDSQQPWEQPPRITNVKEARETIFLEILKKENLESIIMLMNKDMSISKITEMLLFIGFTKGQFNPDMILLLAEPTMYFLLAIAEAIGIDPKIDENDEILTEDEIDDEDEKDIEQLNSQLDSVLRNPNQRRRLNELQENISKTAIPQEIQKRVEEIDFSEIKESLLSKPTKEDNTNDSLLQRK
tara:strand:+ start:1054 stop:1683 length:630 start_codon:yes stop_codon:yes gene_type:complete